jgi:Tfp pilus assembly protein PilF
MPPSSGLQRIEDFLLVAPNVKSLVLTVALVLAAPGSCRARLTVSGSQVTSSPTYDILLTEAKIHLARKRWKEAIYALSRALHEHPNNLKIATRLAGLHYQQRQYGKAIRLYKAYLDRSTPKRNLYYSLGLCYHKINQLRDALGMYARAAQLDPTNLKAYVRIGQVRLRQGLAYDAAKVLKKALKIDPEYLPALEELKVAERLIKRNDGNIYRKRNLVILFHDHKQYSMVDRAFPTLDRMRRRLEDELKYHLPVLWIKVENKVRRFHNPPALYDAPEDAILVEAKGLEQAEYTPILHQMVHLYLEKMTKGNLPSWLAEGLALYYTHPEFLNEISLRTTAPFPVRIPRNALVQRTYLRFEENDEGLQKELAKAFVAARYLVETYGLVGLRKLLMTFRGGEKDFWKATQKALLLDRALFERKITMYAIRGHYFSRVTASLHP